MRTSASAFRRAPASPCSLPHARMRCSPVARIAFRKTCRRCSRSWRRIASPRARVRAPTATVSPCSCSSRRRCAEPMNAAIARLRTRVLAEAERRLPALTRLRQPEVLPVRLDRRRIYVLPTGFGVAFGLLLVVMLVGALNYGNNPAVLLTCLLGATCGASLFFGFRMLNGLRLTGVRAGEAHAGEVLALHLRFGADGRTRNALRLRAGETETAFALAAQDDTDVVLTMPTTRRGWFRPGRLRIWTDYPLGLFQAWSWIHP